ncbi:VIT1/CCC1 transporter family protein [Aldersonia sp. NBC_00410]|uniref:VIT1/CCC1 transporter family protein n=1 Tax=Aldersonia sp. NBC_00410 TaxID=2975954 RepID=UPI002255D007|nr:VIT1/CCC1 transporter family protein [Aldersonia sp. NBC_00410]MCX5044699.1 VIT1/CCC1 transporter family protein [Aldersonia sp. NBC_00410]
MNEPSAAPQRDDDRLPHEYDHRHSDVSGGWLRAATFGAMDGLVSNTSLIAGVGAASVDAHTVVLTGVAGLVAGAFSMALGEYTSVTTQNEQFAAEVNVERGALQRHPEAELNELTAQFVSMGMTPETAARAAAEVSTDTERALDVHVTQELGIDPDAEPSPYVAAISSFALFSVGALIPLIPYLLGFSSLTAGLLTGCAGLLLVGALTARFTARSAWRAAIRQLILGAIAIGATYAVGSAIGVGIGG